MTAQEPEEYVAEIHDQMETGREQEEEKKLITKEFCNKLGLSQCPGKKIEKGRDGKKHQRDIFRDVL